MALDACLVWTIQSEMFLTPIKSGGKKVTTDPSLRMTKMLKFAITDSKAIRVTIPAMPTSNLTCAGLVSCCVKYIGSVVGKHVFPQASSFAMETFRSKQLHPPQITAS